MWFSILGIIIVLTVIVALTTSFYVATFKGGPFVPSSMRAVDKVLKHAGIKKGDKVYDIGAGDGRFIHKAVKDYGANAVGFEIDPFVYGFAKIKQWIFGWKGKMVRDNFLNHDLSDADIVLCYMLPKTMAKFQPKFEKDLQKGAKIVSYAFSVGTLKPTKVIPHEGRLSKIYIYKF